MESNSCGRSVPSRTLKPRPMLPLLTLSPSAIPCATRGGGGSPSLALRRPLLARALLCRVHEACWSHTFNSPSLWSHPALRNSLGLPRSRHVWGQPWGRDSPGLPPTGPGSTLSDRRSTRSLSRYADSRLIRLRVKLWLSGHQPGSGTHVFSTLCRGLRLCGLCMPFGRPIDHGRPEMGLPVVDQVRMGRIKKSVFTLA